MKIPEDFFRSKISDIPADLTSKRAIMLSKFIQHFEEEAIYIYSIKENRMIYASGWETVLGYKDDEINMRLLMDITAPEHAVSARNFNDKALIFILNKSKDLEKYSLSIELKKTHKEGSLVPLIEKVKAFNSENGRVTEIIGRSQINRNLIFSKVIRYAVYGPEKTDLEYELNSGLFKHDVISYKEKEALRLITKGLSFKEVAHHLQISQSAIEKRIIPLYKRFGVKSLSHLISYAYENQILQ